MSGHVDSLLLLLGRLRSEIGDIEFGYRAQGLFACTLHRIGAKVREIRHQGHPDIVATWAGRLARFEVEITSIGDRYHTIKADDLASLKPVLDGDFGFLAILDATHPVRWAVIEYGRIRKRLGRWPLATLHAIADANLSKLCTEEFCAMVANNHQRLHALTFHLLCDRVLRGLDID